MSAALAQLTKLPLKTYKVAANFNNAPLVANLNRAPSMHTSYHKHFHNSSGYAYSKASSQLSFEYRNGQ